MVRDDLYITVPTFFRCPISLDVMKSPVSLSTGVTYDRSSIQRWLDGGHNTCPATMQVLESKEFIPNHNLQRLIRIWLDSIRDRRHPAAVAREEIELAVKDIRSLSKIAAFAEESEENRKVLVKMEGFVARMADLVVCSELETAEAAVRVLDLVRDEIETEIGIGGFEKLMMKSDSPNCLQSILRVLRQGSCLDSRIGSVRIIQSIAAVDAESKLSIAESDGLLSQLVDSIGVENDSALIEASLSCLIAISTPKRVKPKLVGLKTIGKLRDILRRSPTAVSTTEKALKLLESVSSCREGRAELCGDGECVEAVVRKAMKVSDAATEVAVTILWSLCYLFRDQRAAEAVVRSNGLTRILLLMQSNCSPAVRQMSTDMLKIFRVNSKSCLSSYDTKTTHIMPF
ncbi:U-box domain-containing protein 27 [Linum perenne]